MGAYQTAAFEQGQRTSVAEFLNEHLPNCQCAAPVRHDRSDHSAGHVEAPGVVSLGRIAPAALSATAVDKELRRYDEYMTTCAGPVPRPAAWR